jgi:hypothetical protein
MPDNALMSISTSQFQLTAIVAARDIQQLDTAQDKAKASIKKEQGRQISEREEKGSMRIYIFSYWVVFVADSP